MPVFFPGDETMNMYLFFGDVLFFVLAATRSITIWGLVVYMLPFPTIEKTQV